MQNSPVHAFAVTQITDRLSGVFPALAQQVQEMPVTDARLARNFPGSLWR